MDFSLEDAWSSPGGAAFVRNVWPMYLHEISAYDTDFYRLDAEGRWQPDLIGDWLAPVTPERNLRDGSRAGGGQPFQRAQVIRADGARVGFLCIGLRPFRYMPEGFDCSVAELFVLHRHRRSGAARAAVSAALVRHPGRWHLRAIHDNARALAFWRPALVELEVAELRETREEKDVVFSFRTRA